MKRRDFIRLGGLSAAAATAGMTNLGAQEPSDAPKKSLRAGLIGTGWYGNVDLYHLMQVGAEESSPFGIDVVSLCDVDRDALENSAKRVSERQNGRAPKKFHDFRGASPRQTTGTRCL